MKGRKATKASLLEEIRRKTKGGNSLIRNLLLDDLSRKSKPKKSLEYVAKRVRVTRSGNILID
jgi:hypothetical protein